MHVGFSVMVRLWGWESWGRDQELDRFDHETPLEWFSTEGLGYVGGGVWLSWWQNHGWHEMEGAWRWDVSHRKDTKNCPAPNASSPQLRNLYIKKHPGAVWAFNPMLAIYPDKTIIWKRYVHIFIGTLFTLAKTWEQPKCPSRDEWIRDVVCMCVYMCIYTHTYIHTHIYTQWNTTRS